MAGAVVLRILMFLGWFTVWWSAGRAPVRYVVIIRLACRARQAGVVGLGVPMVMVVPVFGRFVAFLVVNAALWVPSVSGLVEPLRSLPVLGDGAAVERVVEPAGALVG